MRGILTALLCTLLLGGCTTSNDSTATSGSTSKTTTPVSTSWAGGWGTQGPPSSSAPLPPMPSVTAPAEGDVATVARQYVLDNLMAKDFQSYKCPPLDAGTAHCWAPYVVDLTYSSGVLRVVFQVDRSTADGEAIGEAGARAVANFIRLGSPPSSLSVVNWVEATDGAGTHIAQESVG